MPSCLPKVKEFPCANCGTVFLRHHSAVKFCCDKCRDESRRRRDREYWANRSPETVAKRKEYVSTRYAKHKDEILAYQHDYYARVKKPKIEERKRQEKIAFDKRKQLLLDVMRMRNACH